MTADESERDKQGRFAPGQSGNPDTQWGPDNPPPKSPGRPKKDAWVGNIERMLETDGRLGDALASRLAKIALQGRDSDALKAIDMIQSRVGGPLPRRVDAEIQMPQHTIELVDRRRGPSNPPEKDHSD